MRRFIDSEQDADNQLQVLARIVQLLEQLYVRSPKRVGEIIHQRQVETEQEMVEFQPKDFDEQQYLPPRVSQPEAMNLSIMSKHCVYLPLKYPNKFWRYFKRLIMAYIVFLCFYGQPQLFFVAIYQGFNCGWSSEVANPYTCDK